jgi:glycosyltransferase involved in cell wall biosynthesis
MRWANCFVLPSRIARDGDRDGLANVLLEAAAIGLPLVTTNVASARDFVDESTGWMSEANNPRDLARVVELVFAAPHETQRRCENARRRLENRFDVDVNVDVLKRAFEEAKISF